MSAFGGFFVFLFLGSLASGVRTNSKLRAALLRNLNRHAELETDALEPLGVAKSLDPLDDEEFPFETNSVFETTTSTPPLSGFDALLGPLSGLSLFPNLASIPTPPPLLQMPQLSQLLPPLVTLPPLHVAEQFSHSNLWKRRFAENEVSNFPVEKSGYRFESVPTSSRSPLTHRPPPSTHRELPITHREPTVSAAITHSPQVFPRPPRESKNRIQISNDDSAEDDDNTQICNSPRLKTLIEANIIAENAEKSKRTLQRKAETEFGGYFNVICGTGFFSYIAHTDEFCLGSRGAINCYVFSPVCTVDEPKKQKLRQFRRRTLQHSSLLNTN